jgi:hypothetical protein
VANDRPVSASEIDRQVLLTRGFLGRPDRYLKHLLSE